jgi:hypothetical protein
VTHIPTASDTSLREVHARADIAHHIISGFALAIPALSDLWQQIDNSISDIPALLAEITRQSAALAAGRLSRANLAAAGLATLGAWHGGEPDPLSYLRDELAAQGFDRRRP